MDEKLKKHFDERLASDVNESQAEVTQEKKSLPPFTAVTLETLWPLSVIVSVVVFLGGIIGSYWEQNAAYLVVSLLGLCIIPLYWVFSKLLVNISTRTEELKKQRQ